MNGFFELVDKYKYGIIATFAAYIGIFMYLQIESYTKLYPIPPFHEGPSLEKEIELTPDQIEVPPDFDPQNVKSFASDANDKREKSFEKYNKNQESSSKQAQESVKEYEKRLFEESGGAANRERIQAEAERNKKDKSVTSNNKDNSQLTKDSGNTGFKGSTMVTWNLSSRTPHQNNEYFVRNPGYTCGFGAKGTVVIDIRVNQNGDVVWASQNSSLSSGGNYCMVEQAIKYAKMSRFAFSSSAPKSQDGTITYVFISQ